MYNYNSSQNVLVLVQRNRKRKTLIILYEMKDIFEIREDLFNDISRRRGTSIIIQVL